MNPLTTLPEYDLATAAPEEAIRAIHEQLTATLEQAEASVKLIAEAAGTSPVGLAAQCLHYARCAAGNIRHTRDLISAAFRGRAK